MTFPSSQEPVRVQSIEIVLDRPEDMDDARLTQQIRSVARLVSGIRKAGWVACYQLGRLLNELKRRPAAYAPWRSFTEFIQKEVIEAYGISRSEIYSAMRVAAHWPNLSEHDAADIGHQKLAILSGFSSHLHPQAQSVLELARRATAEELKQWAVSKGLLSEAEIEFRSLRLRRDVYEELMEVVGDARVQSAVGSSDVSVILKAMIAEFRSALGV